MAAALRTFSAIVVVALVGVALVASPERAEAVSGSDFDPGNIISDQRFFASSAMTEGQIQDFLNGKVAGCASGYTCLKDYRMTTFTRPATEAGHCATYSGAENELASRIIYKTAQACGINPQVLLVLLQKETSLVTGTSPGAGTYRKAMGYGCPDTSPCEAAFYGFYNQVYKAAWQFRQYSNHPDRQYHIGGVSVGFHPKGACGSTVVNIRNQATANLYNYTPYQPNAAALANVGGLGNTCSSYGNRNFWVFFSNWFGSPTQSPSPFGAFDLTPGLETIAIGGWAIDRDTTGPVRVDVYADGHGLTSFLANSSRPDVGAAYPGSGDNHGMSKTAPLSSGSHEVCLYGINVGVGSNTVIGCQRVNISSANPFGGAGITVGPGGLQLSGWSIDPETKDALDVHVYIDGHGQAIKADQPRPDVGQAFPGYGDNHGFSQRFDLPPGNHSVCAFGINVGLGISTLLTCRDVTVPSGSPFGGTDVTAGPGGVQLRGWTIDPDTANALDVHVYIDGRGQAIKADKPRPDVGRIFSGYGDNHGVDQRFDLAPGKHSVCVFGIDVGVGGNTLLACHDVTVPSGSPFGGTDATVVPGGVQLRGWTIDPETADALDVHVYIDGKGQAIKADKSRPDVGRIFKGYGDSHGIDQRFDLTPGKHSVCAFGINVGIGSNTLLACYDVTLP